MLNHHRFGAGREGDGEGAAVGVVPVATGEDSEGGAGVRGGCEGGEEGLRGCHFERMRRVEAGMGEERSERW